MAAVELAANYCALMVYMHIKFNNRGQKTNATAIELTVTDCILFIRLLSSMGRAKNHMKVGKRRAARMSRCTVCNTTVSTKAGSTLSVVCDTFTEHTLVKFKIMSGTHGIVI